jgi:protein TonB
LNGHIDMTEFRPWPKVPMSMWALAAMGAVTIHLGCVALALSFMERGPDDEVGAPAVEIGIEVLAPHTDTPDLPPGPDVEASIASPQTVDQSAMAEQTDLPRAVPVETDDPERLVAPTETAKPKAEPTPPAVPTVPSVESAAVEATAPPSSEMIEESTRSITPAQGIGVSAQRAGDMAEGANRPFQPAQAVSREPIRTGCRNPRGLRARRDWSHPLLEHRSGIGRRRLR